MPASVRACSARCLPMVMGLAVLPATGMAQQPTPAIRGVVQDTTGRPLPGAEIVVGRRSAMTGTDGRFVLDSLTPTRHLLVVRLIGYAPIRSELDLSDGGSREVTYQLEEAPAHLPMIVVEGTRSGIWGTVGDLWALPVPGARVEARGPRGGEVATDSLGRFAFPRATGGIYQLRVTSEGFAERRMLLEVDGRGKEVAVTLLPGFSSRDRFAERAAADLGQRLVWNLRREMIGPGDLANRGEVALCDVPRVRSVVSSQAVLIINGRSVIWADGDDHLANLLCAWRADEVELVEFGERICDEVTGTLHALVGGRCFGRVRGVRSLTGSRPIGSPPGRDNPPYVAIWEKR